jgi:16S rRNA (uracil1498-N3)-methyltransferase
MDIVVQKATELGVRHIQPTLTERAVVKLDATRARKRMEHWEQIAVSAAEQSGRCLIPKLSEPAELSTLLGAAELPGTKIIFDTEGDVGMSELALSRDQVIVCTGPEGGFSPDELQMAESAGFRRVCLGGRILRTETAPIVALTLLQYLMGDLDLANTRL